MAAKKNGHDRVTVEMVGLLRQLVEEVQGAREESRVGLREVREELHAFREETGERLGRLEKSAGELVTHANRTNEVFGERHDAQRALEARVVRLEEDRERLTRLEEVVLKKAS